MTDSQTRASHPIQPVATSVAAFVDTFADGPLNRPVRVSSFAEFARQFGGLDAESEASYGVQQFFANGGAAASIVRVETRTRADLVGDPETETGLFALVDDFNLLCVPATVGLSDEDAEAVSAAAEGFCTERRAFYLLDVPQHTLVRDTVSAVTAWMGRATMLRSRNAAVYFPRIVIADTANGGRPRTIAPSGTIAGLCARMDAAHGVWRAPAGRDATLTGVQALALVLTDAELASLGALGVNALRTLPGRGPICWGARTFSGPSASDGADRYVSTRRLALFIEESLTEGTAWVVLEENGPPLWAEIRVDVQTFMQRLFQDGAFQGRTPREAYFVKCDQQTTTAADIARGVVNVIVGFAPLKPAEFVVIEIRQMVTP